MGNCFFASAYTKSSNFFGVSDGWDWAESLDAEFGCENLFVRISKAQGGGDLIHLAEGTAIGFTAQAQLDFKAVDLQFSFEGDRFFGGDVETVFGDSKMQKSDWNKRFGVRADYRFSKTATFSSGVGVEFLGSGERLNRLESNLSFELKKGVALSLDSSYLSDGNGSNATAAGVHLDIRW